MLRSLADITDGFATDQLTHCLQTATYAEKAGADDEVIVASLCHDIGKAISVSNHGAIAAEILRPYVRPDVTKMISAHQDFQGRHYYAHFGGDPDMREKYVVEPAFELAAQFADEWDQLAFDPDDDTYRSSTSSRWCARSSVVSSTDPESEAVPELQRGLVARSAERHRFRRAAVAG